MKKKILFIFAVLIITCTLTNCNKSKFNFKTKEEIINSFDNYEIEIKISTNTSQSIYLIKEDERFVYFRVNNGYTTLYDKTTKTKYLIKHYAQTKAIYLSTDDIEKQIYNIKEKYLAAHVVLSNEYKQVEDAEVNGILCNVYRRENKEDYQMCYVSKEDGFCVKTYSDVEDKVVSYEILKYQKGNISCLEYFNYSMAIYSLWPDHELAMQVPEITDGTYESYEINYDSITINYKDYEFENAEVYVALLKQQGYSVDAVYINQSNVLTYLAYNEEGYRVSVRADGAKQTISVEIFAIVEK